jgi:hypothetical protein
MYPFKDSLERLAIMKQVEDSKADAAVSGRLQIDFMKFLLYRVAVSFLDVLSSSSSGSTPCGCTRAVLVPVQGQFGAAVQHEADRRQQGRRCGELPIPHTFYLCCIANKQQNCLPFLCHCMLFSWTPHSQRLPMLAAAPTAGLGSAA